MICYATRERAPVVLALALLLVVVAPLSAGRPDYERYELINPFVSPEYSQWLLGAIAWMADEKEIEAYLALTDDEAAAEFIEAFWAERDPYPKRPDNPLREEYEERAEKADSLYAEAGYPGRRTPRGIIYTLYGEPEEVDYQVAPDPQDPLIEVWIYPKKAEKGLDRERPDRSYRFIKRDELTRFYERQSVLERRRRRPEQLRRPPL